MKRFKEIISAIFWAVGGGIVWSIVSAIVILLMATSFLQAPIITIFVAICFVPFHYYDFKKFYEQKDWFIIGGRFFCMVLISSFLVGLFRLALESAEFRSVLWLYIFLVSLPILFILATTYLICNSLFPNGALIKKLDNLIEGSKKLGVFWNY